MLIPVHEYLELITMNRELRSYLEGKYAELDIIYSQPICWKHDSPDHWVKHLCKTKEDCDCWLEKAVKYDREQRAKKEVSKQLWAGQNVLPFMLGGLNNEQKHGIYKRKSQRNKKS